MSEERVERRLAAILAADACLMGQDEAGALARLPSHRGKLIDPKIAEEKGRIVNTDRRWPAGRAPERGPSRCLCGRSSVVWPNEPLASRTTSGSTFADRL
jgi:hypothetical protein